MAHQFCRGIAQQVEQRSPKPRVVSSILTAPAIHCRRKRLKYAVFSDFLFYEAVICPLFVRYPLKKINYPHILACELSVDAVPRMQSATLSIAIACALRKE